MKMSLSLRTRSADAIIPHHTYHLDILLLLVDSIIFVETLIE